MNNVSGVVYGVDSKVHANGELILDPLIDLVSNFTTNVLVFVGCAQDLMDFTIFTV